MTRLLVDTSAYSAFMRGHPEVKELLQRAEALYLTPIVLGELRAGFERGRKRRENERILEQFLASPRARLASVDEETAKRYATIYNTLRKAGTPIPINDVWIASSAMQHGLTIVTADTHFQRVVQVLVHHVSTA